MSNRPLYLVILKRKSDYAPKTMCNDTLMTSPTGAFVFESYQQATFAFEREFGSSNPFVGCEVVRLAATTVTAEDDEKEQA